MKREGRLGHCCGTLLALAVCELQIKLVDRNGGRTVNRDFRLNFFPEVHRRLGVKKCVYI